MESNVFHTIEQKLPSFSKAKHQIASYILKNPNEAPFQTAAQIGKAVNISESTVVRFAADLGYKGFPDLQKALQKEVKTLLQKGQPPSQGNATVNIINRGVRGEPTAKDRLCTLLQSQDPEALKTAVEELARCEVLYLLPASLGCLLLPYCKYLGETLLDTVIPLSPDSPDSLFSGISAIAPGDAVFAPAFGQIPPLFIFAIEQCKQRGAQVIILTDSEPDVPDTDGTITLRISPLNTKTVPDLTRAISLVHGLFSLLEEYKSRELYTRKKIIKEIWDSYEKFQK